MKKFGFYFDTKATVYQEVILNEGIEITYEELLEKLNQGLILIQIDPRVNRLRKVISVENGVQSEIGYVRCQFFDASDPCTDFRKTFNPK